MERLLRALGNRGAGGLQAQLGAALKAVVVKEAKKFFDARGIRHSSDNDSVTARFVGPASSDFTVKISAAEAGGIVVARYVVTFDDKLRDLQWRQDGIRAVSIANYGLVPGSFQCDPRDGEVKYENCFPVVILEADALQRALQEFFTLSISTYERYSPVWQAMLAQKESWRSLLSGIDPALTAGVGSTSQVDLISDQIVVMEAKRFFDSKSIKHSNDNDSVTASFSVGGGSDYTIKISVGRSDGISVARFVVTFKTKLSGLQWRQDGIWAVCVANYRLVSGAFQCDPRDGEMKYENAFPVVVRETGALRRALQQFLGLSLSNFNKYKPLWQALLRQDGDWRVTLAELEPQFATGRTPATASSPAVNIQSEPQPEAIPVPNDHTCPNNHALLFQAGTTSDITCDACGRSNIVRLGYYFACRPCNYDICRVCAQLPKDVVRDNFEARQSSRPQGPTAVRTASSNSAPSPASAGKTGLSASPNVMRAPAPAPTPAAAGGQREVAPGTPSQSHILEMGHVQVDMTQIIGSGSFGIVVKASYMHAPVVVKIPHQCFKNTTIEQRLCADFLEEIKIHCSFRHPNIATVYGACQDDKRKWMMVMEFCNGGTLEQHIDNCRLGGLPTSEAVRIATDIASGMAYLHLKNVLHADLKPANILMHEGTAKVSDFGLSVVLSASRSNASQRGGSPLYVAPEVFARNRVSKPSDVYAYSLVVYELLTLEVPYEEQFGGDVDALKAGVQAGERPPLAAFRVDPELGELIRACWAPEPSNRWTFEGCIQFFNVRRS